MSEIVCTSAWQLSLTDQMEGLSAGALSSESLIRMQIERIDRLDPKLNAFVHHDGVKALAHARALDEMRNAGIILGPLHGVTLAVKDLFDVRGMPTGGGTRSKPPRLPDRSATVVHRLMQAGAIVIGKSQTVEYAFGGWGTNAVMGTPWNPWDMDVHRVPGGSSSGSAVAVASGMASAALGSDTGGSVRIPAGLCGLTALKTSPGLVSRMGLMALCPTHDTVGPMARTAQDCAWLLDAISGPDVADPWTYQSRATRAAEKLLRPLKGLRFWRFPEAEYDHCSSEQLAACLRVEQLLERLGLLGIRQTMPVSCVDATRIAGMLMSAEAYASMGSHVERDELVFDAHVRRRILSGRDISAADYLHLMAQRRHLGQAMLDAFMQADVLVFPTNTITAIPVSEVDENQYPLSLFGRFVNLMDLCALALPVGLDAQGMPLSVQLIAPAGNDELLLALGHAIQRVTDWHRFCPPALEAQPSGSLR